MCWWYINAVMVWCGVYWKLLVPPRLHFFLWLTANNKIVTRDNLAKRQNVNDKTCLFFFTELETVNHLLFYCVVAKVVWCGISQILAVHIGADLESVAKWWICNNNHMVLNMVPTAVMWSLWKEMNDLCFERKNWIGVQVVWRRITQMLRKWRIFCKDTQKPAMNHIVCLLESNTREALQLEWR